MISLLIICGIAIGLFAMAFASKRRFGILGLAITAGSVIQTIWNYDASLVVSGSGLIPKGPLTDAVVPILLIMLPAVVLLFTGYKYKSIVSRTLGSLLFALFALAFLMTPIGTVLPVEGLGATVFQWLTAHTSLIIGTGVVLAVVDLFLRKPAPPPDVKGKKKK